MHKSLLGTAKTGNSNKGKGKGKLTNGSENGASTQNQTTPDVPQVTPQNQDQQQPQQQQAASASLRPSQQLIHELQQQQQQQQQLSAELTPTQVAPASVQARPTTPPPLATKEDLENIAKATPITKSKIQKKLKDQQNQELNAEASLRLDQQTDFSPQQSMTPPPLATKEDLENLAKATPITKSRIQKKLKDQQNQELNAEASLKLDQMTEFSPQRQPISPPLSEDESNTLEATEERQKQKSTEAEAKAAADDRQAPEDSEARTESVQSQPLQAVQIITDDQVTTDESDSEQVNVSASPIAPQNNALGTATPAKEPSLEFNLSFDLDSEDVLPQLPAPGPIQNQQQPTLTSHSAPRISLQPSTQAPHSQVIPDAEEIIQTTSVIYITAANNAAPLTETALPTEAESFINAHQFTNTPTFTNAHHPTNIHQFTNTSPLINAHHFINTHQFTSTHSFDNTDSFDNTESFTNTHPFTNTHQFTNTPPLTNAHQFTNTPPFTSTHQFTNTSPFTNTHQFTNTPPFTNVHQFTNTPPFTNTHFFNNAESLNNTHFFNNAEETLSTEDVSNSDSRSKPEEESQPLEMLPIHEPAAGGLSPNVLTGTAALALAAYWCYMNQDELCALLVGYDSACSSGWSWGGGL